LYFYALFNYKNTGTSAFFLRHLTISPAISITATQLIDNKMKMDIFSIIEYLCVQKYALLLPFVCSEWVMVLNL